MHVYSGSLVPMKNCCFRSKDWIRFQLPQKSLANLEIAYEYETGSESKRDLHVRGFSAHAIMWRKAAGKRRS